jgi:hypothetical protein
VVVVQNDGPMLGIGVIEAGQLLRPKVVFDAKG